MEILCSRCGHSVQARKMGDFQKDGVPCSKRDAVDVRHSCAGDYIRATDSDDGGVTRGSLELNASGTSQVIVVGVKASKGACRGGDRKGLEGLCRKCRATTVGYSHSDFGVFYRNAANDFLLITCVTYSDESCAWVWVTGTAHEVTHYLPYFYSSDARRLKHE